MIKPSYTETEITNRSITISCVVDDQPLFHLQAWIWLHSLGRVLQSDQTGIMVHHCEPLPAALLDKVAQTGAKTCLVERYGTGHTAYCNKLQQFESVISEKSEYIILCDTDLAFLRSPEIMCTSGKVRAKVVDLPNPPTETLNALFAEADLGKPILNTSVGFAVKTYTHQYNCNGGVYVMPSKMLAELAPVWRYWSAYCINKAKLLGRAAKHADQLGFMFAMDQLKLPFDAISNKHNFPLHFSESIYELCDFDAPNILHYHRQLNVDGYIKEPVTPILCKRTKLFNSILRGAHKDAGFSTLLKNWCAQLSDNSRI